jgi:sulfur carrier protein
MKLIINGEERITPDVEHLAGLVQWLDMKADRVAVELNRELVQRGKWAETALKNGDRLEIVHFVGGGRV